MPNKVSERFVVTLVGPAKAELEARLVTSVLERVSLAPDRLKWLCTSGDQHAIEAEITLFKPGQMDELRESLKQVIDGGEIDGAITPVTNRKKHLLICDMDSTIIGQECLDELADFAGLKDEIAAITERAMAGELDFEDALTTRVAMLKGLAADALERCYEERISLNPGARTLVRTMKAAGARCLLVSGGFTYFTSRVAKATGFHADHANRLIVENGLLTGGVEQPILGRQAKLETLLGAADATGLAAEDAVAIGDGANDLAMIEAAGLGIAYRAKPVVSTQATCAITNTDLTAALYFQGYSFDEFVS